MEYINWIFWLNIIYMSPQTTTSLLDESSTMWIEVSFVSLHNLYVSKANQPELREMFLKPAVLRRSSQELLSPILALREFFQYYGLLLSSLSNNQAEKAGEIF